MILTIVFIFLFSRNVLSESNVKALNLDEATIEKDIEKWIEEGKMSETLNETLKLMVFSKDLQYTELRSLPDERGYGTCLMCRATVRSFISLRRRGVSVERLENSAIQLCTLLKFYTPNVCKGIIESNAPILIYIVDNKADLDASTVCGLALESKSCPHNDEPFEFSITVDENSKSPVNIKDTGEKEKILHITDIHYDPNYEVDGNSKCDEPMCCRIGQNSTNTNGKLAGYWGDYNWCDLPWHSIENALKHIKMTHQDISYLYFTGDVVDHGVWATSKAGNLESLKNIFHKIWETFYYLPVFPILGNHEPHPMNVYAPMDIEDDDLSTRWLFVEMADLWIQLGWLPMSARSTILRGGFYTLSPKPGFRIIALNSNVCYRYNWWLLYNANDPYGQLKWLTDTLLQAEKDQEFVHILSHLPPADKDCIYTWSREYRKIVTRFSHIITGQFNGHTHNDELEIFIDKNNNSRVINVAWNAGSLTPFANVNPNYKVYTAQANSLMIEDYDNWMFNLTLANEYPELGPSWFKSYSFKEEYNLNELSYDSLNDWLNVIRKNETVLRQYHKHFITHADPALQVPCDQKCLNKLTCQMIVTHNSRTTNCGV